MKKRALSIIAVLALLIAALTVTAIAAETPIEPNNASAYAAENLTGLADYVKKTCPVCNKEVTWYSTAASPRLPTWYWEVPS